MTFYHQLKKLASDFDLSINHIERDLKYPRNTLSYYKEHDVYPKGNQLLELAMYFDVSMDFFLSRNNDDFIPYPESVQKIKRTMREEQILMSEIAEYTGVSSSRLSNYIFSQKTLDELLEVKIWSAIKAIKVIREKRKIS